MIRPKLLGILGLIACTAPASASASPVYPGCAVPDLKPDHQTFYVDPVHGSMTGDGSAAKPWSTLADVLNPANKLVSSQSRVNSETVRATNPKGPIKAGDLILLESGNHGSATLSNMINSDFITVMAAPGATPIISQLKVANSAKWVFQGLTFEGATDAPIGTTALKVGSGELVYVVGSGSDVVFDHDIFRAAASTNGWTNYDWYNKPYPTALTLRAPCVAVTDSHIYNTLNGFYLTAPKTLIQGNTIEDFSNDGIDLVASDVTIANNHIGNGRENSADPYHSDAIQGWSLQANHQYFVNSNVLIDSNVISQPRDPSAGWMQGISVFDGKWSGLVIKNNVVTTNHWHGIAVYGGENTSVLNNTVIAADPAGHPSWITIHDGKDGTSATALVRNNIATQIVIQHPGTTLDHNMVANSVTTPTGVAKSGTIGDDNTVSAYLLDGFQDLNTKSNSFDMRLKATSTAVGKGVATDAPPIDILGRKRTAPVDLGAYVHEAR